MSAITDRRRELRAEARELQRQTVPELRALVRKQKTAKKKRLTKCQTDARRQGARLQSDGKRARALLSAGIKRAKEKAREAAKLCRVTVRDEDLDKINRALAAVETEREKIADLRRRASVLRDPRGRAGGKRAQEQRRERDDEVARNVAENEDLTHLWQSFRLHTRNPMGPPRPGLSRTEQFLEYVHDNPDTLDAMRAQKERGYEKEAVELLATWPRDEPIGKLEDEDLEALVKDLRRADKLTKVPF